MKPKIRNAAVAAGVILLVIFIVSSLRRASSRPVPAAQETPARLDSAAAAFYGRVEPEGKAVDVSPAVPGRVKSVLAAEGERVRPGQPLVLLERAEQEAEWNAALGRAAAARKAAELSRDQRSRAEALSRGGGIAEAEVVRLRLVSELDEEAVTVAVREAELARERLENRTVRAPSAGIVYKADLRPGEFFGNGGGEILIGSERLELRCDVEVFWIGRLDTKTDYRVFNAESGEPVGKARLLSLSRYLRPKETRTEDPGERLSADYQEAILSFEPDRPGIPIGLPVLVKP
jgi:multidrug efflux pump subunit AcrA (membrane-fusion protein)